MELKIGIVGLGNVGREIPKLIKHKQNFIHESFNLNIKLTSIIGSKVSIHNPDGLNLDCIVDLIDRGAKLREFPYSFCHGGIRGIQTSPADILIEATPTNVKSGQPGLTNIKTAVSCGKHVVSLTKGPFVTAFGEIIEYARKHNAALKYSGATAAALPTIDVAAQCLTGAAFKKVEGILNGTTNYILTKMTRDEIPFTSALKEAQKLGIAEPDPTLDIKGYDTAAKLVILCNSLYNTNVKLKDVTIEGIEHIKVSQVKQAFREGFVYKLIGRAVKTGDKLSLEVKPLKIPLDHALASIEGTTKAVRYETDVFGDLVVSGGASSPKAAAAAALKDVINIGRELLFLQKQHNIHKGRNKINHL